jgi:hypothetical protein
MSVRVRRISESVQSPGLTPSRNRKRVEVMLEQYEPDKARLASQRQRLLHTLEFLALMTLAIAVPMESRAWLPRFESARLGRTQLLSERIPGGRGDSVSSQSCKLRFRTCCAEL